MTKPSSPKSTTNVVDAAFDERLASRSQVLTELAANRKKLETEGDKLLAAHFADAIDLDTLKRHQDRIRIGLADIDRRLANEHGQHEGPRSEDEKATIQLAEPFAALAPEPTSSDVRCSSTSS